MKNIVYIQKIDTEEELFINSKWNIPIIFQKIISIIKKQFQLITRKEIKDVSIWLLPVKDYSKVNIKWLLWKLKQHSYQYVLPEKLMTEYMQELLRKNNISYITGKEAKKFLILPILNYIYEVKEENKGEEIAILVENVSSFCIELIQNLLKIIKRVKIITPHLYQFQELEEKLYQEGMGIQLSNSYRRSLAKSKIIINIDFPPVEINEYQLFAQAVIINCSKENLIVKAKSFQGIVINTCHIHFDGESGEYDNLIYYESLLKQEKSIRQMLARPERDNVIVTDLIGNRGRITKKELENL